MVLDLFAISWKMWRGYRLKSLSILVFTCVVFTFLLLGIDVLFNAFSYSLASISSAYAPPFFVNAAHDYDLDGDFALEDLAVPSGTKKSLAAALPDFRLSSGLVSWFTAVDPLVPEKEDIVCVVATDLASIGEIFPTLCGEFSTSFVTAAKERPLAMANRSLTANTGFGAVKDLILLGFDYNGNYNAMRVAVAGTVDTGLADSSMHPSILYMDISQLDKFFGLPSDKEYPIFLAPSKAISAISAQNMALALRVKKAATALELGWKSSVTISKSILSSFELYVRVLIVLAGVLVLVLIFSVSTNLFIGFQSRLSDFGVFKAMGLDAAGLFLLILFEIAIGLAISLLIAAALNLLSGAVIRPFVYMDLFVFDMSLRTEGVVLVTIAALIICFSSIRRSWQNLAAYDPVSIIAED